VATESIGRKRDAGAAALGEGVSLSNRGPNTDGFSPERARVAARHQRPHRMSLLHFPGEEVGCAHVRSLKFTER